MAQIYIIVSVQISNGIVRSLRTFDNIYTVRVIALSKIKLLKRGLHDRILNSAEHKLDVFRIWWLIIHNRSMQNINRKIEID